jgi:hypothetical protein
MAQGGSELVTVGVAARWWKVSRGSVYNWIREGLLTCFRAAPGGGDFVAARGEVRAAAVLRKHKVRDLGIEPALLERALRTRVVTPSHGRLSLDDLDAIRAFGAGGKAPPAPSVPPPRQSGVVPKALEWNANDEAAWVERGAHPEELPDGYFDMPTAPEFIGPADLFRYTPGDPVPDRSGARYVRRSAGYERRDGRLVWCEQDDRFAVLKRGESLSREQQDSNREYRLRKARWKREVWLRKHRRKAR